MKDTINIKYWNTEKEGWNWQCYTEQGKHIRQCWLFSQALLGLNWNNRRNSIEADVTERANIERYEHLGISTERLKQNE